MADFQKTGQRTSFVLGIEPTQYASTNSLAASYKPMKIIKHRHRQILMEEQQHNKENKKQSKEPKFDRETLIKTSWSFGDAKNDWTTDAKSSYIQYNKNDQYKPSVSTAELQKTHVNLGTDKIKYETTTKSAFVDIVTKKIPQAQATISKQELQKSTVTLGDGKTRYWEKSTK